MPYKLSIETIFNIKELYESGKSISAISREIGICDKTISKYLHESKIKIRNRIVEFNESYFDKIDTQSKAYLLGYIFADGYVRKSGGCNSMRLKIHRKDIHILNFLQKELESNYPIRKENGTNCLFVEASSLHFVNSLISLGCVQKKSLVLKYPIIDKKYWNSFIHGYFDGDGSIYFSKKKDHIQRQFKLLGTFEFLSSIRNYFFSVGIESYDVIKYPSSRIFQLRVCKKESLRKIYNMFYHNKRYEFLERKRTVFFDATKLENSL